MQFFHIATCVWACQFFSVLTLKCTSRYSGVQFFLCPLQSYLRTRRFSEVTFRPSRHTKHWKTQHFATSLTFRACWSSFFPHLLIFFLAALFFQLSILSEVRLLNFLRLPHTTKRGEISWNSHEDCRILLCHSMRCQAVGICFLWHSAAPPGQDGKVKTFFSEVSDCSPCQQMCMSCCVLYFPVHYPRSAPS